MRKPPKRMTAERLIRITAHYLERYTTSSSHLRRLLYQRSDRAAAHHEEDPAVGRELVDAEVQRLIRVGILNDAAFARDKARSLVRRGNGTRLVQSKLRDKGIPSELIDQAMADVTAELGVDPQLVAVAKVARRKKIGPWGPAQVSPDERWKNIQRLGRAGFSYDLAQRVVDARDPDELLVEE